MVSDGGKAIVGGRCYINKPLSGDIDTSELKGRGISELWFSKGGITSLNGLPDGLKRLVVRENQLNSLPIHELPNLVILDAESNNIEDDNLEPLLNLSHLNLAKNRLRQVRDLPPKLIEANFDYNPDLNSVDLESAKSCKKMSCRGTKTITIHCANNECNIITDDGARIRRGGGPKKAVKASETIAYPDPEEAFDKYYQLKSDYEDSIKKAIRKIKGAEKIPKQERIKKARQYMPKCVSCDRNGGTHFDRSMDKVLTARCAVKSNPCELHIEIKLGDDMEPRETIDYFEQYIAKIKDNIIRLKLDTLFNYVSENESVDKFTKLSGNLNNPALTKQLSEYKHFFENQMNNPETNQTIRTITERIYERLADVHRILDEYHQNSENKRLMKDIGRILAEIDMDTKMLRRLNYPIMEMIEDRDGYQVLRQKSYDLQSYVEPEVIHFRYGSKRKDTGDKAAMMDESITEDELSDYVQVSPEFKPALPYEQTGSTVVWNDAGYKAVWTRLPQKYQELLLRHSGLMRETLDVLAEKYATTKSFVPEFVLPRDTLIPPNISGTSDLDFGNIIINDLVSRLTDIQRNILANEVRGNPRTAPMTEPEKKTLENNLKQMLMDVVRK
jgi:hypothetical protein